MAEKAPERGYDEIVAQLGKVVERLEQGGLSLEESIAAFEEGVRLARLGQARLAEAERKVELLLKDSSGQERFEAFEPGEEKP